MCQYLTHHAFHFSYWCIKFYIVILDLIAFPISSVGSANCDIITISFLILIRPVPSVRSCVGVNIINSLYCVLIIPYSPLPCFGNECKITIASIEGKGNSWFPSAVNLAGVFSKLFTCV